MKIGRLIASIIIYSLCRLFITLVYPEFSVWQNIGYAFIFAFVLHVLFIFLYDTRLNE